MNSSGSITKRTHLMKIIKHNNSAYLSYNLLKHHWTLNQCFSIFFFSFLSQNSAISSIRMSIKSVLSDFGDHWWKTLNFIHCFLWTLETSFNITFILIKNQFNLFNCLSLKLCYKIDRENVLTILKAHTHLWRTY